MVQCAICNRDFMCNRALANHLRLAHKLAYLDYSICYNSFKKPLCKICGEVAKYTNNGLKFGVTCGKKSCKTKFCESRVHSDKTKEILRRKRFEYLKKKLGETAWERRNKGKLSYLEQWFFDKVIIKYNLFDKFDIINEYPEYPYFIDFAFLNIKTAVELDGKQHFRNNKNQERDRIKQEKLTKKGWKVFKIKFDELNEEKINEFIEVTNNPNIYTNKTLEPKIYKFLSYKKYKAEERSKAIKKAFINKEKTNVDKVRNSQIDFSRFGWVTKVAKLINKRPQKINGWMKKYCSDILDKAFLKGTKEKKPKKLLLFSNVERTAKEKGYYFDGNLVKNKNGKLVKTYFSLGYPSINIVVNGKSKRVRLHRLRAYLLYGDKIYEPGKKVTFKNKDKKDISDSNVSLSS